MSEFSAEIWERSGGLGRWAIRWLPGAVAGIAAGGLAADRGGYFPTTWGWAVVPLCWVAVMALFVRDRINLSRPEIAYLVILFLIPIWYATSIFWSQNVPQTIYEVERALVYPSGALAVLLVTRRPTTRHVLAGILVGITAVCWYSIAERLFPSVTPTFDAISTYRLTGPVTYWNALGIYSAIGALLAAALATSGRSVVGRALAGATLPVLVATMYLTFSRGAWIAMAVGVIGALAISRRRLRLLTSLLALAPAPAIGVLIASRSAALTRLTSSLATAQHDGHQVALAIAILTAVSAAVAVAFALAERRLRVPAVARKAYLGAVGVVAAAVLALAFAQYGNPVAIARKGWGSFTGPPVQVTTTSNLNQRLFSLSSNGRTDVWSQALDAFAAHPLNGIGGGSFERWWERHRTSNLQVVDAHSLYLEVLAELGLPGLLLVLGAIALPVAAAIRNRADPLVPLVFGAFLAFVFHAGIDWDWEVSGVALAGFLVGATLLAIGRGDNPRPRGGWFRWPTLALTLLVGIFSLYALAANRFISQTGDASVIRAADKADRADAWAPWSPVGWALLGDAQRSQRQPEAARLSYLEAIKRDPTNYLFWLDLALSSSGPESTAAATEALRLNPLSPEVNSLRPYFGLPPAPAPKQP